MLAGLQRSFAVRHGTLGLGWLRELDVDRAGRLRFSLSSVGIPESATSRDPANFRGLVLGCIEANFCKKI